MAIAEAASPNYHLIEGIIVLILWVPPPSLEQRVAQSDQTGKVYSQVRQGDQL